MPFPPETEKEVWLALRADGYLGTGLPGDPYDASSPTLFDARMDSFAENTTIHLGPGVFQTRGFNWTTYFPPEDRIGWLPESGQKIFGAGIHATVLKLVDARPNSDSSTMAIGGVNTHFLTSFEASDFTVDCNLAGQPIPPSSTYAGLSCSAIWVAGKHVRIRRIRAINFGSQVTDNNLECFVLSATQADPGYTSESVDCVMENCIIEKPSRSNRYISTCLALTSNETPQDGVMAYHRACAIRNCLVNCEYSDNPVGITGITYSGTTATVTTKWPHNRFTGQWVVVTGALENGVTSANYNGSFPITRISDTQFSYNNMPGTPTAQPTGEMYIGKYPSHVVPITGLTIDTTTGPPYTVTVTTFTPHNRVIGENVVVANVSVPGLGTNNAFNGSYPIAQILSPIQLTYTLMTNPGTPNYEQASVGAFFTALSADAGISAVAEGNRVYHCLTGGPYHDSYSTRDLMVRNNYYYQVNSGPNQSMGFLSIAKSGQSLTHTGTTANFTTNLSHGFSVGQAVQIQGATPSLYNGTFVITSVPSPAQFTYLMASDPGSNASGSFTFAALWQVGRLVIENNIIELVLSLVPSGGGHATGILVDGQNFVSPYVFGQLVIRGNVIRNVDNAFDALGLSWGIYLNSCQNAIVENNVVNLNSSSQIAPYNIVHSYSGAVKYFNNQTPAGKVIQGYSYLPAPAQSLNELTTDTDLALLRSS